MAAAQAAYTLLADDSESGSGSDSSLGGAQGSVGAAEQQITVEADGSDKSAPVKQRAKAAGAEARAAAAGGVAASGAAAAGDGAGGGAVAVRGAAAGGAGMRRRPRLWSLKKAGATVAAVRLLKLLQRLCTAGVCAATAGTVTVGSMSGAAQLQWEGAPGCISGPQLQWERDRRMPLPIGDMQSRHEHQPNPSVSACRSPYAWSCHPGNHNILEWLVCWCIKALIHGLEGVLPG